MAKLRTFCSFAFSDCSEYFHTVLVNPAALLHCSVLPWQGLHCSLLCSPAVSVHHCCLEHFQFQSGALQSLSAAFPAQEIPEAHCLVGLCACAGCRSRPADLDTRWTPPCLPCRMGLVTTSSPSSLLFWGSSRSGV